MVASVLFVAVVSASFIFTKWLALAGGLALWSAWRAMRLSKNDPTTYGGYRAALAVLVIVAVTSSVSAGLGLAYIPKYLDAYKRKQEAATYAPIYHIKGLLDEYRSINGTYPVDTLAFNDYLKSRKDATAALPTDYWEKAIEYQSSSEYASKDGQTSGVGIAFNNFQLRSAGPDGEFGTPDDIIMRDGIFISASEAPKPPVLFSGSR
jgi:hypothetical protein